MKIVKPRGLISGFYAETPDPHVPEILFLGEQWAPQDYAIHRHSHFVWEFYLQLDGWSHWIDSTRAAYKCMPGTLFSPPPGLEHELKSTSQGRHHFFFAALDVEALSERFPEIQPLWNRSEPVFVPRAYSCESSFRTLIRETVQEGPLRSARLRVAVEGLLLDVSRLLMTPSSKVDPPSWSKHSAVESARSAMELHPSEPWRLKDLAHIAGLSPNHLASLFTAELGVPPHRYLLGLRISHARERLQMPQESIKEIAFDLGFLSSQHFSRAFRQATGLTPTDFRDKALK